MNLIQELQKEAHETAKSKGWHEEDKPHSIGDLIALCHSELSEALEEYRSCKDFTNIYPTILAKPSGFPIELADCVIRIMDMCELLKIDLYNAIRLKMDYNKTRPYRHGGKFL